MIRRYHTHKLQTNPRHREEEVQKIYSTGHPKDNESKATCSLSLVKMIAKLERTYCNAYIKQ